MLTSSPSSFLRPAAALLVMLLVTAACADCPACSVDNGGGATPASYIQMAPMAPPDPLIEQVPPNNSPRSQIWRPGYWDYSGGDFHWVSGEYIDRPSPTAVWSPDHWAEHTYGWGFVPGYWQ